MNECLFAACNRAMHTYCTKGRIQIYLFKVLDMQVLFSQLLYFFHIVRLTGGNRHTQKFKGQLAWKRKSTHVCNSTYFKTPIQFMTALNLSYIYKLHCLNSQTHSFQSTETAKYDHHYIAPRPAIGVGTKCPGLLLPTVSTVPDTNTDTNSISARGGRQA